MSLVEDTHKLIQDLVVPDLKALTARVDALERTAKEDSAAAEKLSTIRFDLSDNVASARHDLLVNRLDQAISAFQAHHGSVIQALQLDRRIERIGLDNLTREKRLAS